MSQKVVELSGQCVLKIKTGQGSSLTTTVPKKNLKTGVNNADGLIREVIHFGIMRHGTAQFMALVRDKVAQYDEDFLPDVVATIESPLKPT